MGHTCHSISAESHGKFLIYIAPLNPYFDPRPSPPGRLSGYPDWSCVETTPSSVIGNPCRLAQEECLYYRLDY